MDVRTQMRSAAQRNARRTAVVAGGRRLSFAEAWGRGIRMANALRALGIEPQDRVGVVLRTDTLPKTPVGKIKRKELREPYWEGQARRVGGA